MNGYNGTHIAKIAPVDASVGDIETGTQSQASGWADCNHGSPNQTTCPPRARKM